jgi:hypothetical protein
LESFLAWVWIHLLLVIEGVLVVLYTEAVFRNPDLGSSWLSKWESSLGRFAGRKTASIAAIIALALVLRSVIALFTPIPEPGIHDEFSNLLAADTFAHGRLTNPTHLMWVHFESFQIEHQPSYASMYPPGQGLVLALGERLGHPIIGVWIMGALMCGAICWMLQGWFSPSWALLGAGLVVIRLATFNYWTNSYMVGALPATGGALVLGALPRILRRQRALDAIVLGAGIVLLVNSRPFEGAVLSAAAVLIIAYHVVRNWAGIWTEMRRVVLPLALILVPTAALMGYYNWRVFGSALTMPYQINRATYAMAGVFLWDTPKPAPVYRHKVMADYYTGWELGTVREVRTVRGFLDLTIWKLISTWQFYIGPVLTIPLLVLPVIFRDRRIRPLVLMVGALALALFFETWFMPHYAAPIAAAIFAILVQCLRHIRTWWWKGKPVGIALVRMVPVVCVLMLGLRMTIGMLHLPVHLGWPNTWATIWTVPLGRQKLISELESRPGLHLVLVSYGTTHDPFREYVYNAADIDRSRIVWARDMGVEQNRALLEYFRNRQIWELDADAEPLKLVRLN